VFVLSGSNGLVYKVEHEVVEIGISSDVFGLLVLFCFSLSDLYPFSPRLAMKCSFPASSSEEAPLSWRQSIVVGLEPSPLSFSGAFRALGSGIGALCSFARLKRQHLKRSGSSPRAMLEGKHPRGAPTALTTALGLTKESRSARLSSAELIIEHQRW
jgi:hypothetical protein